MEMDNATVIIEREPTEEEIQERITFLEQVAEREAVEKARLDALESARAKFRAFKLTDVEIDAVFSQATLS